VWSDSLVWLCPGLGLEKADEGVTSSFWKESTPIYLDEARISGLHVGLLGVRPFFNTSLGLTQAFGEPSDGAFPHPQSADPKKKDWVSPPGTGGSSGLTHWKALT